jgi:carbon monoxide dehydrogenase subunit G
MRVKLSETLGVSADTVWDLLRDFGGIRRWNRNGIEAVSVEGEGIGAIRTIRIPGGVELQEKLEAYDESGRSFSYSFTGEKVIPLEDYLASMTVVPTSDSECRVDWESEFGPGGMTVEAAGELIEGIYRAGFSALKETTGG